MAKASTAWDFLNCAVIVAHPDDETLWAGGTILTHTQSRWTILSLSRKSDADRSEKFNKVMKKYRAKGFMADLDDEPEQQSVDPKLIKDTILELLPPIQYDLVMTHSIWGEYNRHKRHEEIAKAVRELWEAKDINARNLWMFAYEQKENQLPKAIYNADQIINLPSYIWDQKYEIITRDYGFKEDSFEAKTTPKREAFWKFAAAR